MIRTILLFFCVFLFPAVSFAAAPKIFYCSNMTAAPHCYTTSQAACAAVVDFRNADPNKSPNLVYTSPSGDDRPVCKFASIYPKSPGIVDRNQVDMSKKLMCSASMPVPADGVCPEPKPREEQCQQQKDKLASGGGCQSGCLTHLVIGIGGKAGSSVEDDTGYYYTGGTCTAGTGSGSGDDNSTYPNDATADKPDKNGNTCNSKGCTCGPGYAPGTVNGKWVCAKSSSSKGGSGGTEGKPPMPTDGSKPVPGQSSDDGGGGDHGSNPPDKCQKLSDMDDFCRYSGSGSGSGTTGSGTGTGTGTDSPGANQSAPSPSQSSPNPSASGPSLPDAPSGTDLYKRKSDKASDKWDAFSNSVSNAPLISSAKSFFTLGGISGVCPSWNYSVDFLKTTVAFDAFCKPEVQSALALVGPVLMALAAWAAFKIAVM